MEFLADNNVDLMLVDLAMPVMSGIELMRNSRLKYPKLHFVVLTLHQDFEYVQEALRLGAIDYIAKVQLEKERFEEVLGRIHDRILQEQNKAALSELHGKASMPFRADTGYVLVSLEEQPDTEWIHGAVDILNWDPIEIGNGLWFWVPEDDSELECEVLNLSEKVGGMNGWALIKLSGLKGIYSSVVHHLLRHYQQKGFFYEFDFRKKVMVKSYQDLDCQQYAMTEEETIFMKERWLSFHWIYQEPLFEEMLNELKMQWLSVSKLHHLIVVLGNEWKRMYRSMIACPVEILETAGSWQEVEVWFRNVREVTIKAAGKQLYSWEVHDCILKAMKIIHEEMEQPVFATDVAKRVNMSRSYFNQCFKGIVGKSFNEYLRQVRVVKAKEYLLQTNKPIQWVSERTGYMDEKYFSRIFREQTGMLPSEYRQKRSQGRDVS